MAHIVPMLEISDEDLAHTTLVTAAEIARSTGLPQADVDLFFDGWAEQRTYGGDALMAVGTIREVFRDNGIADAASLRSALERWEANAKG